MTTGLVGWLVIIAAGLTWEVIAVRKDDPSWPTLSQVIKNHAPKWIIATILGWLTYHLLSR